MVSQASGFEVIDIISPTITRVTVGYCASDETELDSDGFCNQSVCPRDQELNALGAARLAACLFWCPISAVADKYIQFRIAWQDSEETTYTYYNAPNPNEHKVNFYPPQRLWCGSIGGSIPTEQMNGMYNGLAIKLVYWSQLSWEEGPVSPVDPSPERLVTKVGIIISSKLDKNQYLLTYDAQNIQLE